MTIVQAPIGSRYIFLDTVDSTNNYAAIQLKEGQIGHGTVILAENQTNGRGQRGNSWQSAPFDNLIFSLVICPQKKEIKHVIEYSFATAIAIRKMLVSKGFEAEIKWPNDIIIKNKKVAGILIENSISGKYLTHLIIGVGLNLNQAKFESPNATSLNIESSNFYNPKEMGFEFTTFVKNEIDRLEKGQFDEIFEEFNENLWRKDEEHQFIIEENKLSGIIQGVNSEGKLVVKFDTTISEFSMKEIEFVY